MMVWRNAGPGWLAATIGAAVILPGALCLQAAERWRIARLPVPRDARLALNDIKMPSHARGVAVGYLAQGGNIRHTSLLTADGGKRWVFADTPETGLALFFLDAATGWMAAAQSVWRTTDAGFHWERLPDSEATRGVSRVYFKDQLTGWAAGARMSLFRTRDGGATWEPAQISGRLEANPAHTSYDWIAFADQRFGMIAGASVPPRPAAAGARELPHLTLFLDTRDGGETWTASSTSMFGRVTRVAFDPRGRGLGLIEFRRGFEYPSEVFSIDWRSGHSTRVFRRADVAVTDIGFDQEGRGWLAGIGRSGGRQAGRIRVFRSADLTVWSEVNVERGASGTRATLALCCGAARWMATDSGLLLRYEGP